MLNLELLSKSKRKLYEKFTKTNPAFLLYISYKYKLLLESITECSSQYWIATDKTGNIEGVLPVMACEGKYGTVLNSLPFYGSNGGICAKTERAFHLLLEKYKELVSK